jgi:hypothetical protein
MVAGSRSHMVTRKEEGGIPVEGTPDSTIPVHHSIIPLPGSTYPDLYHDQACLPCHL